MIKLCQALTYYSLLSSQPHLAGLRWITCGRTESKIFQWNFLWGWKCISRFTRRGSWNLSIFSFCSSLVLLLGCRTLCLETSVQLNEVRIPVKLNRYMINLLSGLKEWIFSFVIHHSPGEATLRKNHLVLWREGKSGGCSTLSFIKVFNPFYPLFLQPNWCQLEWINGW